VCVGEIFLGLGGGVSVVFWTLFRFLTVILRLFGAVWRVCECCFVCVSMLFGVRVKCVCGRWLSGPNGI
jgi:hypothetical protein